MRRDKSSGRIVIIRSSGSRLQRKVHPLVIRVSAPSRLSLSLSASLGSPVTRVPRLAGLDGVDSTVAYRGWRWTEGDKRAWLLTRGGWEMGAKGPTGYIMIDTADTIARIPIARCLSSLSLSFSSRVPQSGTRNFPSTFHSFLPRTLFLPSGSTGSGDGAPSENEKAPPPPPEFSPVTIGSLARGTRSSGLHTPGPFSHSRRPTTIPLSSSRSLVRSLYPLHLFSPTPFSSCRHESSLSGAPFVSLGSHPFERRAKTVREFARKFCRITEFRNIPYSRVIPYDMVWKKCIQEGRSLLFRTSSCDFKHPLELGMRYARDE